MEPFHWTCPFCATKQMVTGPKYWAISEHIGVKDHIHDEVMAYISTIGCSNPDCRHIAVTCTIWPVQKGPDGKWKTLSKTPLVTRQMLPQSFAKPQPDYIPAALREDYEEACLIRDLSPKAAATLTRRCLQGMIRDFCGIAKGRLVDEINALRKAVDGGHAPPGVTVESVDAIDHVRRIGNIGAHMEKDIDVIVPVEPEEAQILIELVESLFEEWYVARETRRKRFESLKAVADSKKPTS